jgi:hypothetical protein
MQSAVSLCANQTRPGLITVFTVHSPDEESYERSLKSTNLLARLSTTLDQRDYWRCPALPVFGSAVIRLLCKVHRTTLYFISYLDLPPFLLRTTLKDT